MRLYGEGTFTGSYQPVRSTEQPDLISIHEWGIGPGDEPGLITTRLAEMALEVQDSLPFRVDIVGTRAANRAVREVSGGSIEIRPEHVVGGESSDLFGRGLGAKGELEKLRQVMDDEGLELPMLLGHANHIGRVGLQAVHAGIPDFIVPLHLPRGVAPRSSQVWTRHMALYTLRELVGVPMLHLQGKF